jgi:hypothetical protein
MIVDECCLVVLQKIKTCSDPVRSREIVAEADRFLEAASMTGRDQTAFWRRLRRELNIVAHQLSRPPERNVASARAVVAAAQAAIAECQRRLPNQQLGLEN